MPGLERVPPDVRTVHLGGFTRAHAESVAGELEARGITWWYKEPGYLSQIWEHGQVHIFVDRARLAEAHRVAAAVLRGEAAEPGSGTGTDQPPAAPR